MLFRQSETCWKKIRIRKVSDQCIVDNADPWWNRATLWTVDVNIPHIVFSKIVENRNKRATFDVRRDH